MAEKRTARDMPDAFVPISKRPSPDRAVMEWVEQYRTLHSNAVLLQQHLHPDAPSQSQSPPTLPKYSSSIRTSPEMSSSEPSSASPSPTLEAQQFSPIASPTFQLPKPVAPIRKPSHTPSMAAIPEDTPMPDTPAADDDDAGQLYTISLDLKSTLTDLLNTDAVRHDDKMRMWVQSKLMEAEMELKKQRRRRSSATKSPI